MNRNALGIQLKAEEGYVSIPYLDTKNIWTVGYGHNIHLDDISAFKTASEFLNFYCNRVRHEAWFQQDISIAIAESDYWISHSTLSEARQRVLAEMFFVLGSSRARKFVKFKEAVDAGDHHTASAEIVDSKWGRSKAWRRVAGMAERWAEG